MEVLIVQQGDTVRFTASFSDWDGIKHDPDSVTFKFYDDQWTSMYESLLGPASRTATGEYQFDYTPTNSGVFYYEFTGQLTGSPALRRGRVEVRFY